MVAWLHGRIRNEKETMKGRKSKKEKEIQLKSFKWELRKEETRESNER